MRAHADQQQIAGVYKLIEAIKTEDLTKTYYPPSGLKKLLIKSPVREKIVALESIDLRVNRGELFGLIGPNGAGKTSLIKLLTTLLLPTSGQAWINGHHVVEESAEAKRSIGFVSANERSFYWRLSGRQNLMFFAALQNIPAREVGPRVESLLNALGLGGAADDMCYGYSSGMKQKLLIARGLLADPEILFLDEPTSSVDPVAADEIKRLIKNELVEKKGLTVFLTSHRLEEIEELCDRIAIIDKGKINFVGTIDELRHRVGRLDRYIIETRNLEVDYLARLSRVHSLSLASVGGNGSATHKFEFSPSGDDNISPVLRDVLDFGGEVISVEHHRSRLTDMFMDYLGAARHE